MGSHCLVNCLVKQPESHVVIGLFLLFLLLGGLLLLGGSGTTGSGTTSSRSSGTTSATARDGSKFA